MNPKTSPFLFLQQQQSQQSSSLPSLGPSQLRCLTKFSFVPNSHPTFVSLLKNRLHGSSSSGDGTPASCRCRTTTIVTHDLMRFSCVQRKCKQANGHQSQSLCFRTNVNLRVNAPLLFLSLLCSASCRIKPESVLKLSLLQPTLTQRPPSKTRIKQT